MTGALDLPLRGRPRGRRRAGGPGMHGFTLLEVLVALVIAAMALGLMSSAISGTMRAAHRSAMYSEAVVRARSHLAMAMAEEAPVPGDQEGDDGSTFHWHVRITTLAQDAPRQAEGQKDAATLYAVSVWITWPEGDGTGEVRLDSQSLGRPAGAP
jgi:general secretion pathway protein I